MYSKSIQIYLFFIFFIIITGFSKSRSQDLAQSGSQASVWLRPVNLEKVWANVIELTRGTDFKSPAEAVASAKSHNFQPYGGNKTFEAAISIFNPQIAKYFGKLDKSIFSLYSNPASKTVQWRMGLIEDDGTFEALITALKLDKVATQSRSDSYEELSSGITAARANRELYLGSSKTNLENAIRSREDLIILAEKPPIDAGLWFVANPAKWPLSITRNMNELLVLQSIRRMAAGKEVEIRAFPWGESVQVECLDFFRANPVSPVLPAWLSQWECGLRGRLIAQASIGLDPGKPFWNKLFTIITEIERSIPGREKVANARDRINLAALLARISPETDLYPNLIGLTVGAVAPDDAKSPPTVVATLHARDARATQVLVEKFVMPLFRTIGDDPKNNNHRPLPDKSDLRIRGISLVQNRPIYLFINQTDIFIVWGARNVAENMLGQIGSKPPAVSIAESWFNQLAQSGPVHRVITFYPEALVRWQVITGQKTTAWTDAATGLPPVVWLGRNDNGKSRDIIVFSGLRDYANAVIRQIPKNHSPAE